MKKKEQSGLRAVLVQTLIIAAVGLVLCGAAQFLYPLVAKSGLFAYSKPRFICGSVYGWVLGTGNFFGMAMSLILLTASAADKQEGQKRAQAMYMGRLAALLLLAAAGCFIPIFHPVAVLVSLALTQLGISLYAAGFKIVEGSRAGKEGGEPKESSDRLEKKENPCSGQPDDDEIEG